MIRTTNLFVLFLVLKSSDAVYNCDSQSGICSINGQSISASDPFVTNRENVSSITFIIISNSYMPQIPATIFTKYTELTWISISNTSLQDITPNVFKNAVQLTNLLIQDGPLTTLNNGTFIECVKLQNLQINRQQLSSIDIMAFQGLKNLQNLYLTSNKLTSLHPLILSTLPKLMYFNVEGNLLTTIDSQQFVSNPWLCAVFFNGNQIISLPPDLFQTQTILASFYAKNNQLVAVQSYGASYVDVSNNILRNFTISSGESTIHIENNLIRKIICTNPTNLTVKRLYADNNLLSNFLCIRDMTNLTDLSVINNKMPRPTKKAFLKLTNLRYLQMYNMTRFPSVPAKAFSPLTSLSNLRVDRLAAYKNLNITLPKVSILALTTSSWNCTYLSFVNSILKSQKIILLFNVASDRSRCQL